MLKNEWQKSESITNCANVSKWITGIYKNNSYKCNLVGEWNIRYFFFSFSFQHCVTSQWEPSKEIKRYTLTFLSLF